MRNVQKITAIALCILMLCATFAMSFAAFDAGVTGKITVSGCNAGDSFAAYKIVKVTLGADDSFDCSFDASVEPFFSAKGIDIAAYRAMTSDSDEFKFLMGELSAYIKANEVVAAAVSTANAEGKAIFSSMNTFQYLILNTSTTAAAVYGLMTATLVPERNAASGIIVNDVIFSAKVTTPNISKVADKQQAMVDDVVKFVVTATVPAYPSNAVGIVFRITDTMPLGLTYNNDAVVEGAEEVTDYSVSFASGVLTVDFTEAFVKSMAGAVVSLKYSVIVNSSVVIGSAGNSNVVNLEYTNNPQTSSTYTTDPEEETVYSYDILVNKTNSAGEALAKVEFKLSTVTGGAGMYFRFVDGVYYACDADVEDATQVLVTDDNGHILISGIDVGTYYLAETKTISGYVLDKTERVIVIADEDVDGNIEVEVNGEQTEIETGVYELSIVNRKGGNLPETGGIGTKIFTIGGIVLMAVAVVVLLIIRRKKR